MSAPAAELAMPMLAAAIENARNGLPVYPARKRGKAPLYKGWQRAATTKPEHLTKLWRRAPYANVGIACRGIVVLDADSRRGEDEVAELGLPATTTVRTRRGSHFYFLGGGPTVPSLLPDVEARGTGSGVLGAGSIHPSGFEYEWEIPPWEIPPVAVPPVLRHMLDQRQGAHSKVIEGFVFEGGRHVHLLKVAGSLRGRHGVGELGPVLQAINEVQCRPPLPLDEVERLAGSASGWRHPPLWVTDPVAYCCTDAQLSLAARAVLRLLVDHAHADGTCYPGIRRLSGLANAAPNTILRALAELEDAARITVRRHRAGNRYQLLEQTTGVKGRSSVSVTDTAWSCVVNVELTAVTTVTVRTKQVGGRG